MRISILFPAVVFSLLAFSSCQSDRDAEPIPINQTEAQDAANMIEASWSGRNAFANSYDQVDYQAQQEGDLNGFTTTNDDHRPPSSCAAVSFIADPDNFWPAVLTLDYDQGCINELGQNLSGIITATFDGLLLTEGTNINVDFDAFSINAYAVDGTYSVRNDGLNGAGQRNFTHRIDNGQLQQNGTTILTYEAVENHVQTEGQETNFFTDGLSGILDDVFEETVNANGTGALGNSFTITTLEPLTRPVFCSKPVSGKLQYDFAIFDQSAILDFGNGSCDDFATVTIGTYSFTIRI